MKGLSELFSRRIVVSLLSLGILQRSGQAVRADAPDSKTQLTFLNHTAVREARISRDVQVIFVGGPKPSFFQRSERITAFIPTLQDASGGIWQVLFGEHIDVRLFGAKCDGISDDAVAIQGAIDCAIYEPTAPPNVFLPAGRYRVGKTLHIGYGNRYSTLTFQGETALRPDGREALNSLLEPTFADGPCINIQGGRRVHLQQLALRGLNYTHLAKNYDLILDRRDRTHWFGERLPRSADRRSTPHCGIAIDAYAGRSGDPPYPPVEYPIYTKINTQYDKNFSSQIFISDCQINGFSVGVVVQPNYVPEASNGDFFTMRDSDVSYNVTGIALTNSDARCNNIENCRIHFCHTALDGVNFGNGRGAWMGVISACSFDNVAFLVDIDVGGHPPQGGGAPIFLGCYGESISSLGSFLRSDSKSPGTITFDQCKFQFSVKAEEFSPRILLAGPTGTAIFRGCVFMGGFGLHQFDCSIELENVVGMQLLAGGAIDTAHVGGVAAQAFTLGFFSLRPSNVKLQRLNLTDLIGQPVIPRRAKAGDFPIIAAPNVDGEPTYLPWWVDRLCDEFQAISVPRAPSFEVRREAHPLDQIKWNGSEVSFDLARAALPAFGARPIDGSLLAPGDIVTDTDSKDVYYVRSILRSDPEKLNLTLRRLTGLRTPDRGRTYATDGVLAASSGNLIFSIARRFYPCAKPAWLRGENLATQLRVQSSLARGIPARLQHVRPGDLVPLVPDWPLGDGATIARILSVDRSAGILRVESPLPCDIDGECPPFIRSVS